MEPTLSGWNNPASKPNRKYFDSSTPRAGLIRSPENGTGWAIVLHNSTNLFWSHSSSSATQSLSIASLLLVVTNHSCSFNNSKAEKNETLRPMQPEWERTPNQLELRTHEVWTFGSG